MLTDGTFAQLVATIAKANPLQFASVTCGLASVLLVMFRSPYGKAISLETIFRTMIEGSMIPTALSLIACGFHPPLIESLARGGTMVGLFTALAGTLLLWISVRQLLSAAELKWNWAQQLLSRSPGHSIGNRGGRIRHRPQGSEEDSPD